MSDSEHWQIALLKLDQLADNQEKSSKKLSTIQEKLFDPDDGLYARTRSIQHWAEQHEEDDRKRDESFEKWAATLESADEKIKESIEEICRSIKPLAEDYSRRMSRKKWTDKILWTIVLSLIGLTMTTVWKVFVSDGVAKPAEKVLQQSK